MPSKMTERGWEELDLPSYTGHSKTDRIRGLVSGIMTEEEVNEVFGILEEIEREIDDETPTTQDEYAEELVRMCLEEGQLVNYEVMNEWDNVGGIGTSSTPATGRQIVDLEFHVPMKNNE